MADEEKVNVESEGMDLDNEILEDVSGGAGTDANNIIINNTDPQ